MGETERGEKASSRRRVLLWGPRGAVSLYGHGAKSGAKDEVRADCGALSVFCRIVLRETIRAPLHGGWHSREWQSNSMRARRIAHI